MRQYFTSLQVFLAAALALVIFIGVLWAEQSNFNKISSLENPFLDSKRVNERVVVNGQIPQSWLQDTGEVFMLMPGAKFNMTNQARELEDGVMFVNTNFQKQADIDRARQGFEAPFDLTDKTLTGGQVRIGPIVVSVPQGVAVIKRDLVRQEVTVYAHDHPVFVVLPNAAESFMVPPGYMVLVKENRAELLGALLFTKLTKELNLQPLEAESLGMESVQSSLLQGMELSRLWEKQMIEFAETQLVSENRFAPDSMMGRIFSGLTFIQRFYALGVDQKFKNNYDYNQLRSDLKNTYFAFLEGNKDKSVEASGNFKMILGSADWSRFFIENAGYKSNWNDFSRAQRIWYYSAFPDQMEVDALRILWGPSQTLETFKDYQDNFYLYENYISQGSVVPARNQIEFMITNFDSIDFNSLENKSDLTQSRRQLSLLLQGDAQRTNRQIFQLYIKLVGAERAVAIGGSEADQDVRLEVAQELLFFLDQLLDSNTRQDEVIALLEVYKNLEIAVLAESLGRDVFSSRERDTLERVQSIDGLTKAERDLMIDSNASVQMILDIRGELEERGGGNSVVVPVGVQNENDLIAFLDRNIVQTQGINVQLNQQGENNFYTFSQVSYEGYPLTGTFQTQQQQFTYLKLGEIENNRGIFTDNFPGFLARMLDSNNKLAPVIEEEDQGINITTSSAVLQRRNIIDLLKTEGIEAVFDNVIPTNEDLTKAKITKARFEQRYLVNFDFEIERPRRIRNVTVSSGRSEIIIPDRVFPLVNLQESLLAAIEEKLAIQADLE
jgi:uncharacterized protein YjbI with pentapeptide repeats